MKAAILVENKKPLIIDDIILPDELQFGQVLVDLHYSGICGAQINEIVDLMVKEVGERLQEHNLTVEVTNKAREWLSKEGFDQLFGARHLRRTIQRHLENPLSKKMLEGEFTEGDRVVVDINKNGVIFKKTAQRTSLTA